LLLLKELIKSVFDEPLPPKAVKKVKTLVLEAVYTHISPDSVDFNSFFV
jgi:hypothetical protein